MDMIVFFQGAMVVVVIMSIVIGLLAYNQRKNEEMKTPKNMSIV